MEARFRKTRNYCAIFLQTYIAVSLSSREAIPGKQSGDVYLIKERYRNEPRLLMATWRSLLKESSTWRTAQNTRNAQQNGHSDTMAYSSLVGDDCTALTDDRDAIFLEWKAVAPATSVAAAPRMNTIGHCFLTQSWSE